MSPQGDAPRLGTCRAGGRSERRGRVVAVGSSQWRRQTLSLCSYEHTTNKALPPSHRYPQSDKRSPRRGYDPRSGGAPKNGSAPEACIWALPPQESAGRASVARTHALTSLAASYSWFRRQFRQIPRQSALRRNRQPATLRPTKPRIAAPGSGTTFGLPERSWNLILSKYAVPAPAAGLM